MRATLKTLLCILLFLPGVAASGSFDALQSDFQLFEEFLRGEGELLKMQDAEMQVQRAEALLPEEETMEREEATRPQRTRRSSSALLQVMVGGARITFQDVPRDTWFSPYVRSAAERGIVSGYRDPSGALTGLYGPADSVTVEQVAKMAVEAAAVDRSVCPEIPRNRTATGSWSASYIACAEMLGWAVYSDATVDVMRKASRAEVTVTVMQAFSIPFVKRTGTAFSDVTSSTEFAAAIETAAAVGVVSGYADVEGNLTGSFGPQDPVNRAEVAKIFALALQIYGRAP